MSASVHAGIHRPPEQTPPPRADTPREQTLPEQTPPGADTPYPKEQTPPGADTHSPEQTPPPRADPPPPGKQTAAYGQRASGTHPTGMHSCLLLVPTQHLTFSDCFQIDLSKMSLHTSRQISFENGIYVLFLQGFYFGYSL